MLAKRFISSKSRGGFDKNKLGKKLHSAEKMTVLEKQNSDITGPENQILRRNIHFEKSQCRNM